MIVIDVLGKILNMLRQTNIGWDRNKVYRGSRLIIMDNQKWAHANRKIDQIIVIQFSSRKQQIQVSQSLYYKALKKISQTSIDYLSLNISVRM